MIYACTYVYIYTHMYISFSIRLYQSVHFGSLYSEMEKSPPRKASWYTICGVADSDGVLEDGEVEIGWFYRTKVFCRGFSTEP